MSETTLDDADVEYGLHSNIPACCIAAYVADCNAGVVGVGMVRDEAFGFKWPHHMPPHTAEYVPCPDCYVRILAGEAPVTIHKCDDADAECRRVRGRYYASFGYVP